jgi:mono/diheme cytochrome c family protein
MPGFQEKLSRAEIERVVAYVQAMPVKAETYEVP